MIYKTKMVAGANRNFETFDPLDFLAAVTSHIPNRGEHLVRYYGWYSSVQRGQRRRQGREKLPLGPLPLSDDTAPAKVARANGARFIKKVFAADPLVCPDCGGASASSRSSRSRASCAPSSSTSWLSGALLGMTTRLNLDFVLRQRDNLRENQRIKTTGGLATISCEGNSYGLKTPLSRSGVPRSAPRRCPSRA